jgi:hypothetical protein
LKKSIHHTPIEWRNYHPQLDPLADLEEIDSPLLNVGQLNGFIVFGRRIHPWIFK